MVLPDTQTLQESVHLSVLLQAFPYFYVPWDNEAPQEPQEGQFALRCNIVTVRTLRSHKNSLQV